MPALMAATTFSFTAGPVRKYLDVLRLMLTLIE
jgi:hypothetical protein